VHLRRVSPEAEVFPKVTTAALAKPA
jgi:hypothetical protein